MKPAQTPQPRNLTSELLQTYRGYGQTAPGYFGLEAAYQPKYAQLALDVQRQNLEGYDVPYPSNPTSTTGAALPASMLTDTRLRKGKKKGGGFLANDPFAGGAAPGDITATPGHHPGQIELNTLMRGADIQDVMRFGPAATLAYLQANPYLWYSLNNLTGRLTDSPILHTLNQQAESALNSGGQLSPEEQAAVDQQTRAAYATRGLAVSNPAVASEILNRDAAIRQRQAAAQQLGASVQGLNMNQADLVGRASQIFSTTLSDPWQAILNRSSGAASQGQQVGTGARLFDPTNPYAADIYNTNYNAQASANISNANSSNALTGAGIGAIGSIAGALLMSDDRIKADVKDTGERTASGLPVKTWRYKTDRKRRRARGVMASDVEEKYPWAVKTDPISGLKAVDYAAVDAPFDFVTGELSKAA